MLKKTVLGGIILAVFLFAGLTLPCAAQDEDVNSNGLREATNFQHAIRIPYNIKTGNWSTGLHIYTGYAAGEDFTIYFWSASGNYASNTLHVPQGEGWTGMIENLLPPRVTFQSPTMINIYSTTGKFMVTQFIMNGSGFGFQSFYSYPYDSPQWPNWNPTE